MDLYPVSMWKPIAQREDYWADNNASNTNVMLNLTWKIEGQPR